MRVLVFETLDQPGDLWDVADLHTLVKKSVFATEMLVPSRGTFRLHLDKSESYLEAEYEIPDLQIKKYNPCLIKDDYFTAELKSEWEALPEAYEVESDVVTFGFRRVMPDALFVSPDGRLYVYQLVMVALHVESS